MKETFVKSLVVCAAISAFTGGAYSLGASLKSAFSSAVRSEILAVDTAGQGIDPVEAMPKAVAPTTANKPKSKFGFTYEQ